jgi:hypothetical protein
VAAATVLACALAGSSASVAKMSLAPPQMLYSAFGSATPPVSDRYCVTWVGMFGTGFRQGPAALTQAPPQAKFGPPASEFVPGRPKAAAMISAATGSGLVVKLLPGGRPWNWAMLPESLRLSPNTTKPLNSCAWAAPAHPSARATAPAKRWKRGMGKLLSGLMGLHDHEPRVSSGDTALAPVPLPPLEPLPGPAGIAPREAASP